MEAFCAVLECNVFYGLMVWLDNRKRCFAVVAVVLYEAQRFTIYCTCLVVLKTATFNRHSMLCGCIYLLVLCKKVPVLLFEEQTRVMQLNVPWHSLIKHTFTIKQWKCFWKYVNISLILHIFVCLTVIMTSSSTSPFPFPCTTKFTH